MNRIARNIGLLAWVCLMAAGCAIRPATPAVSKPASAPAEGGLPSLGGRKIVVALENAFLPFNFVRLDNGKADGWDYGALAELCKRLDCKPEFQEIAWDNMIAAVAAGQFDMAADGITITDERAKVVDFSDGYISVQQRLMVRKDDARMDGIDAFKRGDYKLGTQKGTSNYEQAIGLIAESRVIAFDAFGDAVQALLAKDVDAVMIDDTAGQGYVGVNADQTRLLPGSVVSQDLGFMFPKGSDLVKPFNAALKAMRDDGALARINGQWFGSAFKLTYDEIKAGPTAMPTVAP